MQIIQNQLGEVDDALAVKLLRQAEITDEHHLEQEIQNIQDRVSRTRQKMAAAVANPIEVSRNHIDSFHTFLQNHLLLKGMRAKEAHRNGRIPRMVRRNS